MPVGSLVRRGADGAWPEPRTGTVRDAVIPGRTDDGDVRTHGVEFIGTGQQRNPAKGRRPQERGALSDPAVDLFGWIGKEFADYAPAREWSQRHWRRTLLPELAPSGCRDRLRDPRRFQGDGGRGS